MYVMNDRAGMISLPYTLDGQKGCFDFMPGKNEIQPEVWKAVAIANKERMDNYYSRILRVFQARIERVPVAVEGQDLSNEADPSDPSIEIEIGTEKIDFSSLSIQSGLDLIENTTDLDELRGYLTIERAQRKPRRPLIKAIEGKIEEIEEFDRRRKDGQEK